MEHTQKRQITTRDRLLRAWENTTELVRDFQSYARETKDDAEISKVFSEFAEDEGLHAAKFRELMHENQEQ